jgi:hypothetical protein
MEIVHDIWMLEVNNDASFLFDPPVSNVFIMRDNELVLVLGTGCSGVYQARFLEILHRCVKKGAKEIIFMLSYGHWFHPQNKEIANRAGFKKLRFLLPEPEFRNLNIINQMQKGTNHILPNDIMVFILWIKNFVAHHDPQYQEIWKIIQALPTGYKRKNNRAAWGSVLVDILCPGLNSYIVDWAEPIHLANRQKRSFGGEIVKGWPIGRFFVIHDASRSSGHVCIYDPLNRLMITGDATLEMNPPFFDCDFDACIDTCRKCLGMAEAGHIRMATDCHRSSRWWPGFFSGQGLEPLDPVQIVDVARGKDSCIAFYRMFVTYFSALKQETLMAHSRIGEATVPEIVEELRKSTNKNVRFKLGLEMHNAFSNPGVFVAEILTENHTSRWLDDERMIFLPFEKWNFLKE